MAWILLIAGVALWWAAHLFKRVAPERRAAMGDKGKGLVALCLLVSIVLMVVGFRSAPYVHVWTPPWGLTHLNNLLMIVAVFLLTPAPKRGRLLNGARHPMLTGFAIWAIAHLLVNGDLAGIVLFGGLLLWVPVEIAAINKAEPTWESRAPGKWAMDAMFLVASAVVVGLIGVIHLFFGLYPFGH
ncbi:NnrU family protein [Chachezhania antarctica]|uniref:NnrU family protein n=1 Tax=Chachezhania antarctica TaxID=2340860 RepID=UPI000EB2F2AC|nr:NnrU family protein [Chachezhania antarctica]|tara:strand:+ start:9263 stop:9817 length:555 start_codon:yes stop_codon:yes gene_type:complete